MQQKITYNKNAMRYYLIAGEASGDLHASNLMRSLAAQDPDAEFRFFGGDRMKSVGGVCVRHYKELAYMGFWPVLTHLGKILRNGRLCFEDISSFQPDAVILIDYPGFNLSIAKRVHSRLHIPVLYYISPKLWAWKGYRIRNIKRDVTALFSILPFEKEYFAQHGYEVEYTGNPSVDEIEQYRAGRSSAGPVPTESASAADTRPVIAILAGSRRQEISRNLPEMLAAVSALPDYRAVIAAAPAIEDTFYEKFTAGHDVELVHGRTYQVLDGARAALVTSGTATLETAILRVPQVVCYKLPMHFFAAAFGRFILKTRFVSLVNLIAGREVVPELLAGYMNAENVRNHLLPLLHDSQERNSQLDGYDCVAQLLGPAGASDNAAAAMLRVLKTVKNK